MDDNRYLNLQTTKAYMEDIERFFFKAMVNGWASGCEKIKIADMPAYKAISFRDGNFYLLDRYCVVSKSQKSAGTTTIWYRDEPVWVMNYGGFYEESAIVFLKRALLEAYKEREFVGGRGPIFYSENEGLNYVNRPLLEDFAKFEGREEVFNASSGKSLGFHEYWGMSLL